MLIRKWFPLFRPDDENGSAEDTRTPVQKERDGIEVEVKKPTHVEEKEEEKEVEAKTEEVEEKLEASDDEIEELKDQLEDKTLTAKQREKLEGRIEKERKKNASLREENESLKRQLAAKPDDEKVFTEEEITRRAKQLADEEIAARELETMVNTIAEGCKKLDKNYQAKINAMVEDAGAPLPVPMLSVLSELPDNGAPVLMFMANEPDEYEEILKLNPARQALKLKEISDKLLSKKVKQISKVPEAKEKIGGNGNTPEARASEKDSMEAFVAKRNKEAEEHRRRKLGLH